ncbi:MAG: hypothetical protein Ta2F_04910 [Termitinemataceae bacterium]|nr:MAG: hypothetical protein Ta2F_04910 [Termitinemataceae bacterium]
MIFSLLLVFGLLFIGCTDFSEHSIEAEGEEKQEITAKPEPKPEPNPETETETETETEISALEEINKAANAQAMQAALETYAEVLELDLTVYNMLSQASKTVAAQYVVEHRIYANEAAVRTAFAAALQAAAIAEINNAATAQAMEAALETYAQNLELDLTVYNMLSQASKTVTAQYVVANKIYADKDAVKTAFSAALQAAATAEKNLSLKFAITQGSTGAALVTASFNAVHNYVQAAVFTTSTTQAQSIIKLGDYIDLASLTVAGDTGHGTDANYGYINATSGLRLIVIGINSFNGKNGNNTPHVVFHFNDVPGKHKMNEDSTNTTGYLNSAMHSYVTGNFLTGLKNAGVPDGVLWQPSRRVASSGNGTPTAQTITDKLWLPTAWEMTGEQSGSVASCETSSNQASFTGYYEDDNKRKKTGSGTWYWLASPYSGLPSGFCLVYSNGVTQTLGANLAGGCAPAFCVQ